jgi:hypothetical protein
MLPAALLALSDSQISIILTAASPLPRRAHQAFFEAIAAKLMGEAVIGDGLVARACRELQRTYFDPPDLVGQRGRHA